MFMFLTGSGGLPWRAVASRRWQSAWAIWRSLFLGSWCEWDKIFRGLRVFLPQRFQRGVDQHPYAVRSCFRNFGDLLITEIVLKFQLDHFLLPWRERRHDLQQKSRRLLLLQSLEWHRLFRCARLDQFFVEIHHPSFFATNIERSVPANGEKPGRRLRVLKRTVILKFHKSLLHHITRSFPVAGNARRELHQRNLKSPQQNLHPLRIRVRVHVRHWCLKD